MKSVVATRLDLSPEKIVRAYQVFGSYRAAARILKISHWVVRRYVKEKGIPVKPIGGSWQKGKTFVSGHHGKLARFLRDFPGVRLPHEYEEIQKLVKEKSGVDITLDAIRTYIYRRRKAEKERMNSLPPLDSLPGTILLEDKRKIPFRSIESYTMKIDYHTFEYLISGKLRTGEPFSATIRYEDILPILESMEKL
jgi:hypothetical protein